MNIDENEFKKFLRELAKNLKASGVNEDVISTAIANAIKTREDALKKEKEKNKDKEVRVVTINEPQMLYGPPPVMQKEEVVYEEVVERPQMLYGPPPTPEVQEMFVVKSPQMLYGPPPVPKKGSGRK